MLGQATNTIEVNSDCSTRKSTFQPRPKEERLFTVSVAIPGNLLDKKSSLELKTILAGQIARAVSIFQIDEVVIYDEFSGQPLDKNLSPTNNTDGHGDPNRLMKRLLEYMETPPYLKKHLFPIHRDFRYVGLLPSLDSPHHNPEYDVCPYREGIVIPSPDTSIVTKDAKSYIEFGYETPVTIPQNSPVGERLTLHITTQGDEIKAKQVPRSDPLKKLGIYWGFDIRSAQSLSRVFTQSPWKDGYDMVIGVSTKGTDNLPKTMKAFKHLIIVFDCNGFETAVETDAGIKLKGVESHKLFDHYINAVGSPGVQEIYTEEALFIALARISPTIRSNAANKM